MLTPKESFDHGEHNEKACKLLQLHNFPDWTITTAFYASLHFVCSKIFPFEYSVNGKDKIKFVDITQWQTFKNYTSAKRHTLINDLVAKYCDKIANEYDWLLSTSWNARYHSYHHLPEVVNKAISHMDTIKKYCDPNKKAIAQPTKKK
jgi:hypothetical protein